MVNADSLLSHFSVAGINYRKSDVNVRGNFSISPEESLLLLEEGFKNLHSCFILSTCNRTEIYGVCNDPDELVSLLCKHSRERGIQFIEQGYVKQGLVAVEHLFTVTAGLDSQIIGDYEILSQVKKSAQLSKKSGCLNNFTEKLINFALQASKQIKSNTRLSSGTVSVAYATIEIIKGKIAELRDKKILVIGTGKFGQQVGKNLKSYLPQCSLYFCNRTDEKAFSLATECMAEFIAYDNLPHFASQADIIVVSTAADTYTIIPSFFTEIKPRLILDLTVPQNADPAIKNIPGIDLMNVDEISALLNHTMSLRKAEVPKAIAIVHDTLQQMLDWCSHQATNKLLRTVKSQLYSLSEISNSDHSGNVTIHKTVSALALELRNKKNKGCQCIHALNNYLQKNYEAAC